MYAERDLLVGYFISIFCFPVNILNSNNKNSPMAFTCTLVSVVACTKLWVKWRSVLYLDFE